MYKSFEAFADGIFGNNSHDHVHADADDLILIPYNHCKLWKQYNNELRGKNSEPWKFLTNYTNIVDDVSRRLGFQHNLEMEQISDMFNMCSYEIAFNHNQPSAWCSVISLFYAYFSLNILFLLRHLHRNT